MELKDALEKTITIYWWSMGKKTLDFKGTYKDYFKERGIHIRSVKHPNQDTIGLSFTISLSSSRVSLSRYYSRDLTPFDEAIKVYLVLMGDRARFFNGYGREYNLND